jgi:hypothetical protein
MPSASKLPESNENKNPRYASQNGLTGHANCGHGELAAEDICHTVLNL